MVEGVTESLLEACIEYRWECRTWTAVLLEDGWPIAFEHGYLRRDEAEARASKMKWERIKERTAQALQPCPIR